MKILILYETVYPDFIGGVETRNYELAAALARRGHQVTLAGYRAESPGHPSTPLAPGEGLETWSLGEIRGLYNREGKRSTRQALRFAARVARLDLGEFDVVETPNMPYVHLLPLAARCALAGKPLVVTWYEHWGPYWKGYVGRAKAPAYRAVEWLTAQLGGAVTATSRLTEERVAAARRRLRRRKVELVPCGIDVERVRRAAAEGAREAPAGAPPLLYAGRLLEHKRLDLLLGAVDRLAGLPEVPAGPLLTVFGEGPDRPRLERMAGELGIADRVAFRGHVATSEEVWRELGRARLAVQPSAREGFGLFPLEAMAAGLPIVYCESPESAVGELVRDGIEGVEVPADPEALADEITALLVDPIRHARLAAAARARAAEYDYGEIARRIEQLCEGLITGRRSR